MARAPKAKRYAQALFELARDMGRQQEWLDDLREAERAFAARDVELFLTTPRIPAEWKLSAVEDLLRNKDPMVVNLAGLLVRRQSVKLLSAIADSYQELLDESMGRVYAAVTSAVPVSKDQQERLKRSLGESLGKDIVLHVKEEPGIIGGLRVRVGDQIIDGTVSARLDSLRRRLAKESLA